MEDEKCTGSCHRCSGCGERVVLSCNKEISFVSTITFTLRDFKESKSLCLVTECKKTGQGNCYVKIHFYRGSEKTEGAEIYEITNTSLECRTFEFPPHKDADKAEITVSCENGATLEIEHINATAR